MSNFDGGLAYPGTQCAEGVSLHAYFMAKAPVQTEYALELLYPKPPKWQDCPSPINFGDEGYTEWHLAADAAYRSRWAAAMIAETRAYSNR